MGGVSLNEIEERFFVRGRMEILHVLNDLIHRREPVTVHFPTAGGQLGHLEVHLLDARDHQLAFEVTPDEQAQQQLLASTDCAFVARPDGIRVQFSAHMVQRADWDDGNVFVIPMPERLARLQRQETFRVRIPAEKTLMVRLLSEPGASLGDWPLHDLSAGGLGVSISRSANFNATHEIARVSFLLPDYGLIDCGVQLRHTTAAIDDSNADRYRIGVAFIDLPLETRVAIQRYVVHMEHERRTQLRDHEGNTPY